jgi:hypothetical protein
MIDVLVSRRHPAGAATLILFFSQALKWKNRSQALS